MNHRLLNLLTALSLLLCVAVVAAWGQSYAGSSGIYLLRQRSYSELAWRSGDFYLSHGATADGRWEREQWGRRPGVGGFWNVGSPYRPHLLRDGRYLIGDGRWVSRVPIWDDSGLISSYRILRVPCWVPAALFALTPAARLVFHLSRRSTRRPGHCPECGYDLRATPDRCPECGHAPQGAKAVKRRLLNLLMALSLLLWAVAVLAFLWVVTTPIRMGASAGPRLFVVVVYGLAIGFIAVWASRSTGMLLTPTERQTKRRRAGLCPACGYDLRATQDKCPECGHVPAGAAACPEDRRHQRVE